MKKRNQKKIRWIIRHMKQDLNSAAVARSQKISQSAQQVYNQYKQTKLCLYYTNHAEKRNIFPTSTQN